MYQCVSTAEWSEAPDSKNTYAYAQPMVTDSVGKAGDWVVRGSHGE